MTEDSYRIKYRKGDFEVDVQGDKEWVETKFAELTASDITTKKPDTTAESPSPRKKSNHAKLSLVEFLRERGNPRKHTDCSIIFAYWLHNVGQTKSYNLKDIERCYSEARITPPKNINDIMNKNQAKGYLMPASEMKDNVKTWVITQSGEEYVEKLK